MENPASVLARAQQTLLRTQALYELARTLTQAQEEEEVLNCVAQAAVKVLDVNRSVLITISPDQERIDHFLVAGAGARNVQRPTWDELSMGLTGWALREGKTAVSLSAEDVRESPQTRRRRQATNCGNVVVLPLLTSSAVYGSLTVINQPEDADFTEEDITWLEALSHQAAAALEQGQLRQQILRLAQYDVLTGLPSALLGEDRLRQALHRAHRTKRVFAVLLLNIDSFQHLNETHGRAVGDALLIQIAQRLQGSRRAADTVARQRENDFMVLVEDLRDERDALLILNTVMNDFAAPFVVNGQPLKVTVSVGMSVFPSDGQEAALLRKHAQLALFSAQQAGRASAARFAAGMVPVNAASLIATALHRALEREELLVVYQPQLNVQGQVCGFEALLRWNNAALGTVPPDVFIPIAEQNGMIVALGEWVLRQACRQLQIWRGLGHTTLRMAVNVSQVQLRQVGFVELVRDVLEQNGLVGDQLELELTERVVLESFETAQMQFGLLREMGVHLALDDFGVGHSSMRTLAQLPFNVIKLDQSLIRDLEGNVRAHRIAGAVTQLGQTMQMQVVAEGVETAEQLRLSLLLGCNRTQGYLLGRPMPADAALAWLNLQAGSSQRPAFRKVFAGTAEDEF